MIIWIASYPKSGNTWIRSLLASYLFSEDSKFDFNLLKNIKQFSSKDFTSDITESPNYQTRISKNWIPSQRKINQDKKIHLLKTHNALCSISGSNFTDKFNTAAAIYVVRDPRNLVTSLAHHYELSLDESYTFITNKKKIIFPITIEGKNKDIKNRDDFNFISDWATHYQSWKNIKFCPIKIIKYEDFLINTEKVFISTLDFLSKFLKFEFDKKKINNALTSTSFEILSKMEMKKGFQESAPSSKSSEKIKFFNLGKKNNWKILLDKKLIKKIQSHFKNDMKELGYL